LLADPHAGLVRLQDAAGQQPGADAAGGPREGFATGGEHVDQAPFADLEADQVGHQPRQALERDGVREAQIEDEGPQIRPEGRARLQALRRSGFEPPGAARAGAAMQHHSRHIRFDLGQLDAVVTFERALGRPRYVGGAVRTFPRTHIEHTRRMGMQLPVRAAMRLAFRPARHFARSLLAAARRQARIVRRFRRLSQLRLKPRHPLLQLRVLGNQHVDPLDQRQDQRVLRGAIQRLQVGRFNHPPFESDSCLQRNPLYPA